MPQIAVIDDGELEDVRAALEELGVEFTRWRKGEAPRHPDVSQLLVTTPSHAAALGFSRPVAKREETQRARWVAVTERDTHAARQKMMAAGFDMFVCRPVHPAALRALLHHALYLGDDRRLRRRVVVGADVSVRVGRRSMVAIMVDAGAMGCRLLLNQQVDNGAKISIQLPKWITGKDFWHDGTVVRTHAFETARLSGVEVGVRFKPFSEAEKKPMLKLLNGHTEGPCTLRGRIRASILGPSADPLTIGVQRHRKRAARGLFEESVGIDGLAHFSLDGRDLSVNGLRVAPHDALTLGARLRLELTMVAGNPIVIDSEVARLDGDRGTILLFDWVDQGDRDRLTAFVQELEPIWSGGAEMPEDEDELETMPALTDAFGKLFNRVMGPGRPK